MKVICIAVLLATAMLSGCGLFQGVGALTSGIGRDLDQIGQAMVDGTNAPNLPTSSAPPQSGGGLFAR